MRTVKLSFTWKTLKNGDCILRSLSSTLQTIPDFEVASIICNKTSRRLTNRGQPPTEAIVEVIRHPEEEEDDEGDNYDDCGDTIKRGKVRCLRSETGQEEEKRRACRLVRSTDKRRIRVGSNRVLNRVQIEKDFMEWLPNSEEDLGVNSYVHNASPTELYDTSLVPMDRSRRILNSLRNHRTVVLEEEEDRERYSPTKDRRRRGGGGGGRSENADNDIHDNIDDREDDDDDDDDFMRGYKVRKGMVVPEAVAEEMSTTNQTTGSPYSTQSRGFSFSEEGQATVTTVSSCNKRYSRNSWGKLPFYDNGN